MGRVKVSPEESRPTHHVAFIAPGKEVGLVLCDQDGNAVETGIARGNLQTSTLKISQGNTQYADLELPFNVTPQQDWTGGQNQERFEDNVTKYLQGYRVHGIFPGRLFNGPLDHFSSGYRTDSTYNGLNSVYRQQVAPTGARKYLAVKVTAPATTTYYELWMWLKAVGKPEDLTIRLLNDNAGNPNPASVLKTLSIAYTDLYDLMGAWRILDIPGGQALTASTAYWIEVYCDASDDDLNHWIVGCDAGASTPLGKESSDESSWSTSAVDMYFRLCGATDDNRGGFFYRNKDARYFITASDSGTGAPQIFLSGDRGAADSNSGQLSKLIDASKSWTVNQFAGAVVQLIEGPGFTEAQNWRKIVSNTATELVVDKPWLVTHTTATSYVIKGANVWTERTGHGLTAPPRDRPIEVNGVVYFAQGNAVNIRRHREYNNAGTWTVEWADDGTNKADLLWIVRDATDGIRIWRVLNDVVKASKAPTVSWGTDLTFGSNEDIGDTWEKAVRGLEYIDPETDEKIPWITKTGSMWAKKDVAGTKRWDVLPLPEMATVASELTGRAVLVHNTYLYFSLQNGVEQYFESVVTDLGPTKDRGLPADQRGPAAAFLGYPGRFFMAVDAGDGISTVFMQNGSDRWEQHYQAPAAGRRIRDIAYDAVPGSTPDKLWIAQGNDLIWLNMASGGTNPLMDDEYEFCPESAVTSSRIHAGLQDVLKLWVTLKVVADNLEEGTCWVEFDYKLDDESAAWTTLSTKYDSSPSQEETLGDYSQDEIDGATSKFIITRLRLCTTDRYKTPILKAMLLEAIIRVVIKYGFALTFRVADDDLDLRQQPDDFQDAKDKLAALDEFGAGLQVLTMKTIAPGLSDLKVVIDPQEPQLVGRTEQGRAKYVCSVAITQVVALDSAGS